jgi:hypothetical protein
MRCEQEQQQGMTKAARESGCGREADSPTSARTEQQALSAASHWPCLRCRCHQRRLNVGLSVVQLCVGRAQTIDGDGLCRSQLLDRRVPRLVRRANRMRDQVAGGVPTLLMLTEQVCRRLDDNALVAGRRRNHFGKFICWHHGDVDANDGGETEHATRGVLVTRRPGQGDGAFALLSLDGVWRGVQ